MAGRFLAKALLAVDLALASGLDLSTAPDASSAEVLASALRDDDQCAGGEQCALSALQLRGQRLDAPANTTGVGFACRSGLTLGSVEVVAKKGLALDDTTFEHCPGEVPRLWPHTGEKVKSLRLFKPWGISLPSIFRTDRAAAWAKLKAFVEENEAQILLGVSMSCDQAADDAEWELAKAFMKDLGRSRFMGLAVGNEVELLFTKNGKFQNQQCIDRIWNQRGYYSKFVERVTELDQIPGFSDLPVTAVFGLYARAGFPFVQNSKAGVRDFLAAVWKKYGDRFVFSFNFYPYFDTRNHCDAGSIASATSFSGNGQVPSTVAVVRSRMAAMGAGSARLWVAETGWSTPESRDVAPTARGCQEFSSAATFKKFYQNFLSWDLSGADHAFYFTIHDSSNFDVVEHFGLLENCGSAACKLQG